MKEGCDIKLCQECGRSGSCSARCPNYTPPKAANYCSICKVGIYEGEQFIENYQAETAHYECFDGIRSLLEWLGYSIKTMEDFENERNY